MKLQRNALGSSKVAGRPAVADSPMGMLVMNIRKVGMAVPQWLMAVLVNMGLAAIPVRSVFVLMVRIVCM